MADLLVLTEASASNPFVAFPAGTDFYDFVPQDVWIEPALSGPQIKVSWKMPKCYIDPETQRYYLNDSAGYVKKTSPANVSSVLHDIFVLPMAMHHTLPTTLPDSYPQSIHCAANHCHFEMFYEAIGNNIAFVPYNVDTTSDEYGRMYDLVLPPVDPTNPLPLMYTVFVMALIESGTSADYVLLLDTTTVRSWPVGRHFEDYVISGAIPKFQKDPYSVQAQELRTSKPCGLLEYGYVKPPFEDTIATNTMVYGVGEITEAERVRGAWEYNNVRLSRPHIEVRADLSPGPNFSAYLGDDTQELVPNTIRLMFVADTDNTLDGSYVAYDTPINQEEGELWAEPGHTEVGTVNYLTRLVDFTFAYPAPVLDCMAYYRTYKKVIP